MKITRESDYAIRIILMLSSLAEGDVVGAAKISETQCIPKQFTLKILRELVGAGYVKSFKGVCGGYAMNVLPKDVSLKDVISAIVLAPALVTIKSTLPKTFNILLRYGKTLTFFGNLISLKLSKCSLPETITTS